LWTRPDGASRWASAYPMKEEGLSFPDCSRGARGGDLLTKLGRISDRGGGDGGTHNPRGVEAPGTAAWAPPGVVHRLLVKRDLGCDLGIGLPRPLRSTLQAVDFRRPLVKIDNYVRVALSTRQTDPNFRERRSEADLDPSPGAPTPRWRRRRPDGLVPDPLLTLCP
jgi:hypothetical protein